MTGQMWIVVGVLLILISLVGGIAIPLWIQKLKKEMRGQE